MVLNKINKSQETVLILYEEVFPAEHFLLLSDWNKVTEILNANQENTTKCFDKNEDIMIISNFIQSYR